MRQLHIFGFVATLVAGCEDETSALLETFPPPHRASVSESVRSRQRFTIDHGSVVRLSFGRGSNRLAGTLSRIQGCLELDWPALQDLSGWVDVDLRALQLQADGRPVDARTTVASLGAARAPFLRLIPKQQAREQRAAVSSRRTGSGSSYIRRVTLRNRFELEFNQIRGEEGALLELTTRSTSTPPLDVMLRSKSPIAFRLSKYGVAEARGGSGLGSTAKLSLDLQLAPAAASAPLCRTVSD